MRAMSDWELLEDYVKRRSEAAFSELVRRHIDWVHSVALRRVGDPDLAEDIVQAVFVLLARKAASLRPGTLLGGWLFRTAGFMAKCSLRAESRRKNREEIASAMMTNAQPDESELLWERLVPCLDQAVAALPEADRSAVVLRYYEKRSLLEVGQHLGITEEAAKKRVSRAVEKLRALLIGRGVTLGGAMLAGFLAERTVQAAPAGLAANVLEASLAAAPSSAALPELARGAFSAWRWAKIKLAAGAGLSAALLVFLLGNAHALKFFGATLALSREKQPLAAARSLPGGIGDAAQSDATVVPDQQSFLFRVVAADSGKGLAAARVPVSRVVNGEWVRGEDLATDNEGLCAIPLPAGKLQRLDVGALKDGFVQRYFTWREDNEEEQPLPPVYGLKLEHALAIGGRVEDSQGNAVTSARISLNLPGSGDASDSEPAREHPGFVGLVTAALTDQQGNWHCALIPPGCGQFSIVVQHPDLVSKRFVADPGPCGGEDGRWLRREDLLACKARMVLEPGFELKGFVLDDTGAPLASAKVSRVGDSNDEPGDVKTGADGSFRMTCLPQGAAQVSAWAKGFAPCLLGIQVGSNSPAAVFRLNRGAKFSFRIVDDQEGAGIPNAWATFDLPLPHNAEFRATTDGMGRATFEGIPTNALGGLVFHAGAEGYFIARHVALRHDDPDPVIRLTKSVRVSGTVLDADTREPITDFKAIPCREVSNAGYDRFRMRHGHLGAYSVSFSEHQPPFRVRIEADGYEPAMSQPLPHRPSEQEQDFLLRKKDPTRAIRGIVLLPDGQPAGNTRAALLTFEQGIRLVEGEFSTSPGGGILTTTDAGGEFKFNDDPNAHTVVAADPANGFGLLRLHRATQPYTVQLRPWGRIDGRLVLSGSPAPNWQVSIHSGLLPFRPVRDGLDVTFYFRTTDADGRFSCALVPPGDFLAHVVEGEGRFNSHTTAVEVRSGETTQVQIGGHGRTVIGRFVMSDGSQPDWPRQLIYASIVTRTKAADELPPSVAAVVHGPPLVIDLAERLRLLDFFDDSQEWRAYALARRSFPLQVAEDGSFSVEDIEAGAYEISLRLADTPYTGRNHVQSLSRPIAASLKKEVSVPDEPGASAPIDLGALLVEPTGHNPNRAAIVPGQAIFAPEAAQPSVRAVGVGP
jgi:RNA polymerase sigma factor (sigma-70 family)